LWTEKSWSLGDKRCWYWEDDIHKWGILIILHACLILIHQQKVRCLIKIIVKNCQEIFLKIKFDLIRDNISRRKIFLFWIHRMREILGDERNIEGWEAFKESEHKVFQFIFRFEHLELSLSCIKAWRGKFFYWYLKRKNFSDIFDLMIKHEFSLDDLLIFWWNQIEFFLCVCTSDFLALYRWLNEFRLD